MPGSPSDPFGRRINYLRLSVVDRCNLRCLYCMPAGAAYRGRERILEYDDLYRIARQSASLGMEKIRITGGEPLVRPRLSEFLARLSAIPDVREIVLTTNGLLLAAHARSLRAAGVRRLNVSLDSLDPSTFAAITRGGELNRVLDGMAAAEAAGFPPPKINTVVMRNLNDGEIPDFAALTLQSPRTVRFIEYMPAAGAPDWQAVSMPGSEILARIQRYWRVEPVQTADGAGPARHFRISGAPGMIGIISPAAPHFCDRCNRIRVTASGMARACLFASMAADLVPFLRAGDDALREALGRLIAAKPARHPRFGGLAGPALPYMFQVGG